MSDLISRQTVIDAVTKYCIKYDLRELLADIECLPTADTIDMISRSKLIEELMKGHDVHMRVGDRVSADMVQAFAKFVDSFPCFDGSLPLDKWLDYIEREGNDGRIDQ